MKINPRKRAIFTVSLTFLSILVYIWVIERMAPQWFRAAFFWLVCVGFPIFSIALEQRTFPEFSLDWNDFVDCLRGIVWFTVIMTVFFVLLALYNKSFFYDEHFLTRVSEYFFWAFLQQIGLQTFLTTRVRLIFKSTLVTAFVTSTIFALIHMPNPTLVLFCWIGGFFWCYSYLKTPNLYALAISHGWLAVVALHCVPQEWLHRLRIGPTYWTF